MYCFYIITHNLYYILKVFKFILDLSKLLQKRLSLNHLVYIRQDFLLIELSKLNFLKRVSVTLIEQNVKYFNNDELANQMQLSFSTSLIDYLIFVAYFYPAHKPYITVRLISQKAFTNTYLINDRISS